MKSIAWSHLGNASDAEDAVQETFLKIHRAATTYTGEASFSTWAFRILVNTCYDVLRRRKRRIEETTSTTRWRRPCAPRRTSTTPSAWPCASMLDELPEQRRTVFTLFEIEGLSHAEIAEILGISEGNSKWILFATKKELQQKWNQRERP